VEIAEEIADDEMLLRFLNPLGNHVVTQPDASWRVSSAAFLDGYALQDETAGISVFVESRSNLARLESYFRPLKHGLARVTAGQVRGCGFSLDPDVSEMFPDDLHLLIRPGAHWTKGTYRTKCRQVADLAVIAYLPVTE
jgi:hypothetical protein